jgi:hypothetical protein
MSSDYRYLVIQKNQDGSFSKVTDFTSLTNYTVVKISLRNDCNDSEKEKQICFKFDDKHYLIDWNMDMNSITIDDIQSNLLDINFLNSVKTQNTNEIATNEIATNEIATNEISNTNTDKYYKALGLENTATIEEVKKAYHILALQYHPDKGGEPVKFNEIQNAYNCLIKKDCS